MRARVCVCVCVFVCACGCVCLSVQSLHIYCLLLQCLGLTFLVNLYLFLQLRAKVIQLLALADGDEFHIRKNTRGTTHDIAALLPSLCTYQPDVGVFTLRDEFYASVDASLYKK